MSDSTNIVYDVPGYIKQHPRGCGPSSLMMAMNFFKPKKYPLSLDLEQRIYDYAKFFEDASTTTPRLATFALKEGFKVRFWSREEFPSRADRLSAAMYYHLVSIYSQHLSEAIDAGLDFRIGDFSVSDVLNLELHEGRLIIVLIKLDAEAKKTHNLLIRGRDGDKIYCNAPLEGRGQYEVSIDVLAEEMTLPYAKSALVIGRK